MEEKNEQVVKAKKKIDWMMLVIIICIVGGVGFFAYPIVQEYLLERKQEGMLQEVYQEVYQTQPEDKEQRPEATLSAFFEVDIVTEDADMDPWFDPDTGEVYEWEPNATLPPDGKVTIECIGKLHIPKIDITYLIFEGTTATELRYGIGHLIGSAMFGQVGNCVLPGHRNYTYGKFFNRLDELEIGDRMQVYDLEEKMWEYEVDQITVVRPGDLSVLEAPEEEVVVGEDGQEVEMQPGAYATLYTCHPVIIANTRLAVRLKLVGPPDPPPTPSTKPSTTPTSKKTSTPSIKPSAPPTSKKIPTPSIKPSTTSTSKNTPMPSTKPSSTPTPKGTTKLPSASPHA